MGLDGGTDNMQGTFEMANDIGQMEMGGMGGLSGEEYFETNPNDTSYDMDGTNRDLMTNENIPVDMMSPDVTLGPQEDKEVFSLDSAEIQTKLNKIDDETKDEERKQIQNDIIEYRLRCSK